MITNKCENHYEKLSLLWSFNGAVYLRSSDRLVLPSLLAGNAGPELFVALVLSIDKITTS